MTPESALYELLARLGAGNGATVLVSEEELSQWPAAAVKSMKLQKLLVKASTAASVVCPGCEEECVMPVYTLPHATHPVSFIVCDKRSDINRVSVSAERLMQWRCDTDAICGFVALSLKLRRSEQRPADAAMLNIGIAPGSKRSQMLCLKTDGELALAAGSNVLPLADLVRYHEGTYSIDRTTVRQLVDAATTADSRYTPSNARREARKLKMQAIYESWQREYRELKKRSPDRSDVWYSQRIAGMEIAQGRNAGTIKKNMKP